MTGIRSWTAEVTAFGVVVRIEHDLIHCPLGSFQRSHSPAKANNSPSLTSKQYGCLALRPDKGAGGKYLVLGPGDSELEPEGYFVVHSPTVNIWVGQRALEPNREKALATIAAFRVYPYSQRDNHRPLPTWRQMAANGVGLSREDWRIGKGCPKSSMRNPSKSATA